MMHIAREYLPKCPDCPAWLITGFISHILSQICDFGCAKSLVGWVDDEKKTVSNVGTYRWMAPEVTVSLVCMHFKLSMTVFMHF